VLRSDLQIVFFLIFSEAIKDNVIEEGDAEEEARFVGDSTYESYPRVLPIVCPSCRNVGVDQHQSVCNASFFNIFFQPLHCSSSTDLKVLVELQCRQEEIDYAYVQLVKQLAASMKVTLKLYISNVHTTILETKTEMILLTRSFHIANSFHVQKKNNIFWPQWFVITHSNERICPVQLQHCLLVWNAE